MANIEDSNTMDTIVVSVKARYQSEVRRFRVGSNSYDALFALIEENVSELFDVKGVTMMAGTVPLDGVESLAAALTATAPNALLLTVEKIDSQAADREAATISESTASSERESEIISQETGPEELAEAVSVEEKKRRRRRRSRKKVARRMILRYRYRDIEIQI